MFGPRRGFPFAGLLLFAGGFALASIAGSAASAAGALLFLPLLALKLMFVFFIFGTLMRFAGGGLGRSRGWSGRADWSRAADERRRASSPPREPTQEEKDWARAWREARQEIDDLFPDRPE